MSPKHPPRHYFCGFCLWIIVAKISLLNLEFCWINFAGLTSSYKQMITKATSHPVDQAKTLNLNNLP
jgi:hypothetical protein